jgi:hypothetical protein
MTDPVVIGARKVASILVDLERDEQDAKWSPPPRDISWGTWLAVLMEEVGEAAKEVVEHDDGPNLMEELIHVAAVAHAWIEDLLLKE